MHRNIEEYQLLCHYDFDDSACDHVKVLIICLYIINYQRYRGKTDE